MNPDQTGVLTYNKNAPAGVGSTARGLTHSSDLSREGLAMKATQRARGAANSSASVSIPPEVTVRALQRYYFESPTGCHVSTYSAGSHGYAQIGWHDHGVGKTRMMLCHRVVWVALYGPISDGMTVDHMCKTRKCVNPEHLRLLTNHENARRQHGRDAPLGQCVNGHLDAAYLREEPNGRVRCSACQVAAKRRWSRKQKQESIG